MSIGTLALADSCGSGTHSHEMQKDAKSAMHHAHEGLPNIVETAVAAGSFETLVTAVKAAELADVLSSPGPFTVFAPTDEAFAALPEGTLAALLEDQDALTKVLTYHVVPGALMATHVVKSEKLASVQGEKIDVMAGDHVMIDQAKVVQADIKASNGVIHVIDSVILPPSMR
ncbi:MAG: fasciclin domain-containing protein [Candidatus Eisenbacteria bacterium]|nr:fasciclin domain-containing protein [Candidatus Eisenbacteria bacterium]